MSGHPALPEPLIQLHTGVKLISVTGSASLVTFWGKRNVSLTPRHALSFRLHNWFSRAIQHLVPHVTKQMKIISESFIRQSRRIDFFKSIFDGERGVPLENSNYIDSVTIA